MNAHWIARCVDASRSFVMSRKSAATSRDLSPRLVLSVNLGIWIAREREFQHHSPECGVRKRGI